MPTEHDSVHKNIYINLAKLQAGTLQTLQDEAETMEPSYRATARSAAGLTSRERR